MANYTIIGADQKQYGPITETDIRKWFSEGRLNDQTLAKGEGDAEFRPLSAFPELANIFSAPISSLTPPPFGAAESSDKIIALEKVKAPAIALLITGIIDILLAVWNLFKILFLKAGIEKALQNMPQNKDPEFQKMMQFIVHASTGPIGIIFGLIALGLSVLVLFGGIRMQSLRNYELAFAASIIAMIPCMTPCCLLGLPFGIWALVVLSKPEVKSAFD